LIEIFWKKACSVNQSKD